MTLIIMEVTAKYAVKLVNEQDKKEYIPIIEDYNNAVISNNANMVKGISYVTIKD
jgi:hypothetical protein